MTPDAVARLADFKRRHRPDSKTLLAPFREELVHLHFAGYSVRLMHVYIQEAGVDIPLRTFQRWVQQTIDFSLEPVPEALRRGDEKPRSANDDGRAGGSPAQPPAEDEGDSPVQIQDCEADGEQRKRGRHTSTPVVQKPLLHDDAPTVCLAGAPPDLPEFTGQPQKPKPPVLVDNKGGTAVDSAGERAERLKQARTLREANFVNPVERALGGKG